MTPTLRTLITDAIAIVDKSREDIYDSEVNCDGVVIDLDAKDELQTLDEWLERARKALESQS